MKLIASIVKTFRLEWITLWNGIKSFLGDKPLVSAVASIVVMFIVARDPSIAPNSDNIQKALVVLAGLVVGTYKLVDIINAIGSVYTAKTAANVAELKVLAATTSRATISNLTGPANG